MRGAVGGLKTALKTAKRLKIARADENVSVLQVGVRVGPGGRAWSYAAATVFGLHPEEVKRRRRLGSEISN
jgi:hypothetical protein